MGAVLVLVLIVAVVLSLGPFLVVGGRPVFPFPGLVVGALPLIGKALPARLMLYAFLALAIITALWLGDGETPRWVRVWPACSWWPRCCRTFRELLDVSDRLATFF